MRSQAVLLLSFLLPLFSLAQKTGLIYGRLTDSEGKPIVAVQIAVQEKKQFSAQTSDNGEFEIKVPADTSITLEFSHVTFETYTETFTVKAGKQLRFDKKFENVKQFHPVEIEDYGTRSGTLKPVDPKNLSLIPGGMEFNKILFTLGMGISSTNELSSAYSVRGGNYDENLVYVNDIEVYRPFLVRSGQQEGLSFVNPDMVSNILFSSGGFDAKYGDKMSSVLDIRYRRPKKFAGTASGGLLGGGLTLEGISKNANFTWIVSGRYKSTSYLLRSLDTKGEYKPSFYDVQSYLTYDLTDEWELAFLGNATSNKYIVVPHDRQSDFGTINQALRLTVYFDGQEVDKYQSYLGALSSTYRPHGKNLNLKFTASAYHTLEDETFDILGAYRLDELETDFGKNNFGDVAFNIGVGAYLNHARNYMDADVFNFEHKGSKTKGMGEWLWGAKYQHESISDKISEWVYVDSAGYSVPQGNPLAVDLSDVVKSRNGLQSNRVSGYLQHNRQWNGRGVSKKTFNLGVRANYWDLNNETVVSPRASFSYKPNWDSTDMLFRFSTGFYYQPPFYRELRDLSGNLHSGVKAQQSIHFVLGSDYNFKAWGRPFKFISEIYYKHLDNLVPYEIDNVRIRYYATNNARGYATGIDFKVNGEFVKGIESWASMSIMQTREDIKNDYYYDYYNSDGERIIPGYTVNNKAVDSVRREPGYIPRPTDQRVTFGLFFQDYLPKLPKCKMYLNLIFGTGLPFGPPDFNRYKDTLRMPPYRRVDIGFSYSIFDEEKRPSGRLRKLQSLWVSLEVFNLLATNNTISYIWVRDVTGRMYAIPNYLTNRQLNLRLIAKF